MLILITVENGKVIKIAEEVDVSTFGFFQRNSVGEFIRFTHTVVLGKSYFQSKLLILL